MKRLFTFALSVILLASCSNKESKNAEDEALKNIKVDAAIRLTTPLALADFKMMVPDIWVSEKPANEMRVVQYFLKHYSAVNVLGFNFGNKPEMVEANIQRWKDEYTKIDKFEESKFMNNTISLSLITGTYKKKPTTMMSDEFKEAPGYMTLAAIVPSIQGPYFFKMVGPKIIVEKELPRFKAFLNSYTKFSPHGMMGM